MVAATQNLLMKKLGLISRAKVEAADLERYMKLFAEGLLEEQVRMIQDLFMDHVVTSRVLETLIQVISN
jgi:hypothetical protein